MTKLLQDAIDRLREWPEDRQDQVARALIEAADVDADYQLTDEQVATIEHRRARSNRTFVSVA